MNAVYLVKNGTPEKAFEYRQVPNPEPGELEVLIEAEGFGLNYADVLARLGHYRGCPPLPTVIGYESVGRIIKTGSGVSDLAVGQRVLAFTHFGAYADHCIAEARAVVPIPDEMSLSTACSLAVQYGTAYYCTDFITNLHPGDHVLIHAAAGGVGGALIQLAKRHNCVIFGTASTPEKIKYLETLGVDYPINYRDIDFAEAVEKNLQGKRLDVVFNPVGGKTIKKGLKLLGPGGRMICFGISGINERSNALTRTKFFLDFGLFHPGFLMQRSKAIIGVNMLKVAEYKPEYLIHVLKDVLALQKANEIEPPEGTEFSFQELGKAHDLMESGKSIGKIVVRIK